MGPRTLKELELDPQLLAMGGASRGDSDKDPQASLWIGVLQHIQTWSRIEVEQQKMLLLELNSEHERVARLLTDARVGDSAASRPLKEIVRRICSKVHADLVCNAWRDNKIGLVREQRNIFSHWIAATHLRKPDAVMFVAPIAVVEAWAGEFAYLCRQQGMNRKLPHRLMPSASQVWVYDLPEIQALCKEAHEALTIAIRTLALVRAYRAEETGKESHATEIRKWLEKGHPLPHHDARPSTVAP